MFLRAKGAPVNTHPFGFVFTSASAIGKLCVIVAADIKALTRLLTSSKSITQQNDER